MTTNNFNISSESVRNPTPFKAPSQAQCFDVSQVELPKSNADGTESITQESIDLERAKVTLNLIIGLTHKGDFAAFNDRKYLWWHSERIWDYELRDGNAPSDWDRPKFLKRMNLHLDLSAIPQWVINAVQPGGLVDEQAVEAFERRSDIVPSDTNVAHIKRMFRLRVANYLRRFLQGDGA